MAENTIEQLSDQKRSVVLRKLSGSTFLADCNDDLVAFLKATMLPNRTVPGPEGQQLGRVEHFAPAVWMCQIGKDPAVYGFTAEDAARAAIGAPPETVSSRLATPWDRVYECVSASGPRGITNNQIAALIKLDAVEVSSLTRIMASHKLLSVRKDQLQNIYTVPA